MADYNKKINIKNKRAAFDYEILEEYVAGIVLTGTEIKSLRLGKAPCGLLLLFRPPRTLHPGAEYLRVSLGTYNNHQPRRDRKLLLNRRELDKLERASQDKSVTVVGLRLFLNERGLAKVVIGLARGRKRYDKREYIKEKDARREMDRAMKR